MALYYKLILSWEYVTILYILLGLYIKLEVQYGPTEVYRCHGAILHLFTYALVQVNTFFILPILINPLHKI